MSRQSTTLSDMIDLALGTPEIGCVNYNMLHTVLHGILDKLQIAESPIKINLVMAHKAKSEGSTSVGPRSADESLQGGSASSVDLRDKESSRKGWKQTADEGGKDEGGRSSESSGKKGEGGPVGGKGGGKKSTKAKKTGLGQGEDFPLMVQSVPYHELVKKVDRLEHSLEQLNEISNHELVSRTSEEGTVAPLKDMWQVIQMRKAEAANKEGIDRLMSIVQDMLRRMQKLSETVEEQKHLITGSHRRLSELAPKEDINAMKQELESIVGKVHSLHDNADRENIITWDELEAVIKGSDVELDKDGGFKTSESAFSSQKQSQKSLKEADSKVSRGSLRGKTEDEDDEEFIGSREARTGREVKQRGVLKTSSSTDSEKKKARSPDILGKTGSGGPSPELQEILRVMGTLSDRLFHLKEKVGNIEDTLKQNAILKLPAETARRMSEGVVAMKASNEQMTEVADELATSYLENMVNAGKILSAVNKDESKVQSPEDESKNEMENPPGQRKSVALGALENSMKLVDRTFGALQKMIDEVDCRVKVQNQLSSERQEKGSRPVPDSELMIEPVTDETCNREPEEATHQGEDIESNLKNLEKRLGVNKDEICQLTKKLNQLNRAVSQQLNDAKDRLTDLESRLVEMTCDIKQLIEKMEGGQGYYGVPSPVVVDSGGVGILHGVQKALTDLRAEMERLSGKTDSLQQNIAKQGVEDLLKLVTELDEKKADKTELVEKASKQDLELKLDSQQFDDLCNDLHKAINALLTRVSYLDEECQNSFDKLTSDLSLYITAEEFEKIRLCMAKQFKALTKKLSKMQKQLEIAKLVGDDAAGIKRQIFKCLSCDRTILTGGNQEPKAFVSSREGLLSYRSTKPYTTYELEQIRQHCRGYQMPRGLSNYERALIERQMSRLRLRDFRSNASHYWRNEHPACCKQSRAPVTSPQTFVVQNEVEDVYPDPYSCIRPCGGTHTLTSPYKRIVHVADLNAMTVEEHQNVNHNQQTSQAALEERIQVFEGEVQLLTQSQEILAKIDSPAIAPYDFSTADFIDVKGPSSLSPLKDSHPPPKSGGSPSALSHPTTKSSSEDNGRRFSDPAVASSSKKQDQKPTKVPPTTKSSLERRTTAPTISSSAGAPVSSSSPPSSTTSNSMRKRRYSTPATPSSRESHASNPHSRSSIQETYTEEPDVQQLSPEPDQHDNNDQIPE